MSAPSLFALEELARDAGYDELELRHRTCTGCRLPAAEGACEHGRCLYCDEPHGTGDEAVVVGIREQRSEPWGVDEVELGCGDEETALIDAQHELRRQMQLREVA